MTISIDPLEAPSGKHGALPAQVDFRVHGDAKYTVTINTVNVAMSDRVDSIPPCSPSQGGVVESARQRLLRIASTPISATQRARAEALAERAKRANSSVVTAKFRRIPHAA